ncbi:MAG: MBL fold metallo-hydrolase [Bacteroidia bacterium]|nr:MBL fold metallo-hydrolase [Bacteroidia bacterium]
MALSITSLNSGSNGNCYYVGNETEAVLVDVGISCRELERRMLRSGLSMQKVKAIFISHEHIDHIRGLEYTSRKYKLPVYITDPTYQNSRMKLSETELRPFKGYEAITFGGLSVTAFPKFHDAADPFSFIVEGNGITVGVFTDIGSCCEHVIENFKKCHAIFLEANYDEKMLEFGNYPYHLKKRIRSNRGHLSNDQALKLFVDHKPEFMTHVFLSHLSKDNNDPELARNLFLKHAGETNIVIASRYKETEVYSIGGNNLGDQKSSEDNSGNETVQMSLF